MHLDSMFQTFFSHAAPGAVILFMSENGDVPLPRAEAFDVALSCPVQPGMSACFVRIKTPIRVPHELGGHEIFLVSCKSQSLQRILTEGASPRFSKSAVNLKLKSRYIRVARMPFSLPCAQI